MFLGDCGAKEGGIKFLPEDQNKRKILSHCVCDPKTICPVLLHGTRASLVLAEHASLYSSPLTFNQNPGRMSLDEIQMSSMSFPKLLSHFASTRAVQKATTMELHDRIQLLLHM